MASRPRASAFPVVFGVSLVALSVAYYHRKKLFPDVWERKREQFLESHVQATQFKALVAEGVEKERERRRNEQ